MKRFLAPVLAFVCSLLLCGTALAADATPPAIPTEGDVWDGTTEAPTTIVQKDGVSYYEITKCSQLAYLATVDSNSDWLKYSYLLANDLILNNVTLTWDKDGNLLTNTEDLREWTPIPTFSGTLNGNGHAISGLYTTIVDEDYEATGLFVYLNGRVCDLSLVNCHVQGITDKSNGCVGAISGDGGTFTNCSVSGVVKGACYVGGLCGDGWGTISNCVNYADVYGSSYVVGGIVGFSTRNVTGCTNYGTIKGASSVGGISGAGLVSKCQNFGAVIGETNVGGLLGNMSGYVTESCNFGTVSGKSCVGGIAGATTRDLGDCYNAGTVKGTDKVGGIVGNTMDCERSLYHCYNIGTVTGTTNVGAVIGESGSIWGKGGVADCFYLADGTITGFGNGEDVEDSVTAATATELKDKDTFPLLGWIDDVWNDGWDFNTVWVMDSTKNNGYPYLKWQSLDTIPVTGVSLNKTTLALGVGDAQYLTAAVSPVTAETTLSWKSSDTEVATVTKSGKVTALAPGSATVTVTTKDGGFSASCTVTVTARAQDEYRLGAIQLESMSGETLTAIPKGSFWVSVPLTHLQESGNAVVMLATYDAAGRYLNALCARAEDLPENSTVRLSLLVDNSGGEAARVKAFVVPSLSEPMPIGTAAAR